MFCATYIYSTHNIYHMMLFSQGLILLLVSVVGKLLQYHYERIYDYGSTYELEDI